MIVERQIDVPDVSECIVRGKVDLHCSVSNDSDFIFYPNTKLVETQNISVACHLVRIINKENVYVRILNIDKNTKSLPPGIKLGHLESFSVATVRQVQDEEETPLNTADIINMHTSQHHSKDEQEIIRKVLTDYHDIFAKHKMDLGVYDQLKHTINTGNAMPVAIPPRRIPIATEKEVETHIQALLNKISFRKVTHHGTHH